MSGMLLPETESLRFMMIGLPREEKPGGRKAATTGKMFSLKCIYQTLKGDPILGAFLHITLGNVLLLNCLDVSYTVCKPKQVLFIE